MVDARRSAAAKKGWETRRRNLAKSDPAGELRRQPRQFRAQQKRRAKEADAYQAASVKRERQRRAMLAPARPEPTIQDMRRELDAIIRQRTTIAEHVGLLVDARRKAPRRERAAITRQIKAEEKRFNALGSKHRAALKRVEEREGWMGAVR